MPSNEEERARLLGLYNALPNEGMKAVCRLLAVISVPIAASNLLRCLSASKVFMPGSQGKRWDREDLKALFKDSRMAALCLPSDAGKGRALLPPLIGPLWDEARRRGELRRFNDAVERTLSLNSRALGGQPFTSQAEFCRALRFALTDAGGRNLRHIARKGVMSGRYFAGVDFESAFLEAAASPLDPEVLLDLCPDAAELAFSALLALTREAPETYRKAAQAFFDYPDATEECPELELLRIERLILHGRMEEAAARLEGFDFPQAFSLKALLALSGSGDEKEALLLYQDGLARMKDKKRTYYLSWAGMFYPILLLKTGGAERKMRSYVKAMEDYWGTAENLSGLVPGLRKALKITTGSSGEIDATGFSHDGLKGFLQLLLLHWTGGDTAAKTRREALELLAQLEARGMAFLSGELRALLGKEELPHPLFALIQREEEWERSLQELLSINPSAAVKEKGKRFIWKVRWRADPEGHVYALGLTPVEQTRQRAGWSKGRNVPLHRLYKNTTPLEGMTAQDIQVAAVVRRTHDYYSITYALPEFEALPLLAGHPLVFNEETGERVEITAAGPILSVRQGNRGYVLTLSPFPEEGEKSVAVQDGPNSLRVTSFEPRHQRVAKVLGPTGLMIPDRAKESLTRTLENLASIVTVQSDLEGMDGGVEEVKADGRLFAQIQPDGAGLDVEVVVRPLPSLPCRPGRGGANLFGVVGEKRVRTCRDLEAEAKALAAFQDACPALGEGEPIREEAWRLLDPALALEFLAQLEPLGDQVVAEWPKGQSMKLVSAKLGPSNFNVSIREAKDWFALSGELRVREDLVLGMAALLDAMKEGHGRFVPLGNGEFLALTQEFQRRLRALAALGDQRGDEVRFSPLAAGVAEELLEDTAHVDAAKEWRKRLSLISEAEKLTPALPSTFRGELRDYQLEGFQWLMRLAHWGAGACLADDMGLGKTIQALAVLVARGEKGPSLVVAPTSVCPNWAFEAARFAPTLRVKGLRGGDREEILSHLEPLDVVVTSYGLLQREHGLLTGIDWNVIILDEAQAIKNMGTKRSSSAMKLKGVFRVATTGTPIENQLGELWNLFRFLNPGYLGSFESFWRRFGAPISDHNDSGAKARLRQMIRPFILRRTKAQVLSELPTKTEITLKVDLNDEEHAFYEALRRSALEALSGQTAKGEGEKRFQVLAALMKLRRACCNTALVNPELRLPSAKLEAFSDILTELRGGGHKALVFSQFVDHLTLLREWLDAEGIAYQYLDGSTPQEERERRVAAFQRGEGDCFLISLRAGGTGLNLTAADYVIHMDPWWNPAVESQASDRAHRIGQERPVTVYRLVARGTIEERIVELHTWKRDLADGLLEDSATAVRLSAEELLALIRG